MNAFTPTINLRDQRGFAIAVWRESRALARSQDQARSDELLSQKRQHRPYSVVRPTFVVRGSNSPAICLLAEVVAVNRQPTHVFTAPNGAAASQPIGWPVSHRQKSELFARNSVGTKHRDRNVRQCAVGQKSRTGVRVANKPVEFDWIEIDLPKGKQRWDF
jgi:hypothetical protein